MKSLSTMEKGGMWGCMAGLALVGIVSYLNYQTYLVYDQVTVSILAALIVAYVVLFAFAAFGSMKFWIGYRERNFVTGVCVGYFPTIIAFGVGLWLSGPMGLLARHTP